MTKRDTSEIPRGSKEFERKLNKAAAEGVQSAIERENTGSSTGITLRRRPASPAPHRRQARDAN